MGVWNAIECWFDIFNIFPYYLHVTYWTGKSVRIFSLKQVISGNFRRYDVYSWVWFAHWLKWS